MKIILIILLVIAIFLIYILGRIVLKQYYLIEEYNINMELLNFFNGGEINRNLVNREFKNATLITTFQLSREKGEIWDISQYEKNQIVGLTIFVTKDRFFEAAMNQKEKFMGMELNDIVEILMNMMKDVEDEVIVEKNVEIYQLKDGTFVHRS